jgi:hypothetical protein
MTSIRARRRSARAAGVQVAHNIDSQLISIKQNQIPPRASSP